MSLDDSAATLRELRRIVGNRRFVLLGENGHGVGTHSQLKVALTRMLLDSLGFSVVVFESGYHECSEADAALLRRGAVAAFRDCLAYAFEHAEVLPVFEHLRAARERGVDVHFAGVDYQPQGAVSLTRPALLRQALAAKDAALAERVALLDSALLVASQQGGDSIRSWMQREGADAREAFERALPLVEASARWQLRSALGLLRRGELRTAPGGEIPAAFYAHRDQFMANSIQWIADSLGPARKVVVWMHNDHVRLGNLNTPSGAVPATGGLLTALAPGQVVSVGFFFGSGEVTNNSRVVRRVAAVPEGSLEDALGRGRYEHSILSLRGSRALRRWSRELRPYLRNGTDPDSLRPGAEFDALVYSARVQPPMYRLPNQ